ncbi:chemotaxis protein CheR [Bacillus sp. FJAT-27986]|nr:chemotaxis protein CheR [Bacillus sp. FJAT-27986]
MVLGYPSSIEERENLEIDLLLEAIYRMTGYDFRGYMRSSIARRIKNRLNKDHLTTVSELLVRVIHEEGYVNNLLSDFSINVTDMFRDPDFFYAFRKKIVPRLKDLPEIRIWHAGCSTGEEVYSMAILLEEEGLADKTKIYATDMNEKVIEKARQGAFPLKRMQSYTKNYLQAGGLDAFSKYYKTDMQYAYFRPSLSRNIVFAQHNLVTDGSFNEFHVIICRNVIIYFTLELQAKVFQLFDESLSPGGFLGLGNKESLKIMELADTYMELDINQRLYRKKLYS